MGVWGTGISSNDTYADIYAEFIDLYNEGLSVTEITAKLITENQETIEIEEDSANFWFALAKGQWECKQLDNDTLSRVEHIIESGEDLSVWEELGASSADLKVRAKVLNNFLARLRTERKAPRERKKKRYYDSIFKKGDCLVYKMDNGNYGGAFVLTEEQGTVAGVNYIAITMINMPQKPEIDDFRNTSVYLRYSEKIYFHEGQVKSNWEDQAEIWGYSALTSKYIDFDIEVIGNIPMYKEFHPKFESASHWIWFRKLLLTKDEYEAVNGKPRSTLKLAEWIKKPSRFRLIS